MQKAMFELKFIALCLVEILEFYYLKNGLMVYYLVTKSRLFSKCEQFS